MLFDNTITPIRACIAVDENKYSLSKPVNNENQV